MLIFTLMHWPLCNDIAFSKKRIRKLEMDCCRRSSPAAFRYGPVFHYRLYLQNHLVNSEKKCKICSEHDTKGEIMDKKESYNHEFFQGKGSEQVSDRYNRYIYKRVDT